MSWGEEEELEELQKEFEDNCKKHNIQKSPQVLLSNGFYFGIVKNDEAKASVYLKKALDTALKNQEDSIQRQNRVEELKNKLDIMYCLGTFCTYYYTIQNNDKCREKISHVNSLLDYFLNLREELKIKKSQTDNVQLQKQFQSQLNMISREYLHITRLNLNVSILEALIGTDPEERSKALWESYEKANTLNETLFIPYILLYMAFNYSFMQEEEQAHLFLNLATKIAEKQGMKLFLNYVEEHKKAFFEQSASYTGAYDLVFNKKEHSLTGEDKGCIQFKNQFILLDLLNFLIEDQGKPHSKEDLAKRIWKEDYSPNVHDNKIYATIKRLRDSIEPSDGGKSRYIYKNKQGYYLSDKVKILVK